VALNLSLRQLIYVFTQPGYGAKPRAVIARWKSLVRETIVDAPRNACGLEQDVVKAFGGDVLWAGFGVGEWVFYSPWYAQTGGVLVTLDFGEHVSCSTRQIRSMGATCIVTKLQ
jgi:hypothetical protein